jgi:hypothetical protein
MISQEKFNEIEMEHDCGYWFECCDRACPCAITTENKGLRQDIWDGFKKEQRELAEQYDNDDDYYEPMARCKRCGSLEEERSLTDGLCILCYDDEEDEEYLAAIVEAMNIDLTDGMCSDCYEDYLEDCKEDEDEEKE